jgi:hypothetical protein
VSSSVLIGLRAHSRLYGGSYRGFRMRSCGENSRRGLGDSGDCRARCDSGEIEVSWEDEDDILEF